jgi:hypothetical protein
MGLKPFVDRVGLQWKLARPERFELPTTWLEAIDFATFPRDSYWWRYVVDLLSEEMASFRITHYDHAISSSRTAHPFELANHDIPCEDSFPREINKHICEWSI